MSSSHMKRLAMPRSWPLTRKGDGDPIGDGLIIADTPEDAVDKAVAAAEARYY